MAVAAQDQTGNMCQTKMDFWDGMDSIFMMPSITPTERRAVWSAVSGYVQQQLLQHKGVRVPTLGSFDVVHTEIHVGDRAVALQRPVFYLARNLGGASNLMDNNTDLAGDKQLEPLKYAEVAGQASVSRRKAESCILGTTSLLYHCLAKGESIAFILRDVGVLLIEGRKAHMRFYPDFLEKMTGKKIQDRATFKVFQQLDLVVSREVPVASLAFTSRVLVFPEFEPASLPLSLFRDRLRALRHVPGGDRGWQKESLPPVRRGMEGRLPGLAVPAHSSAMVKQPWDEGEMEMKDSSGVRRLPEIPGAAAAGKKQFGTDQAKGKPAPKGQGSEQGEGEATATQRGRVGREGEAKDPLGREGKKKVHSGRGGASKDSLGKEGASKDSLRREGEKKVHLQREGASKDSLGRKGASKDSLGREGTSKDSLGKEGASEDSLGREGEKKVPPGKGEKKVPPGKEGEKKVPPGGKGEKKAHLGRGGAPKDYLSKEGEKKISPGRKGEKNVSSGRKGGEKKVSPGRKGKKQVRFGREEVKDPLDALRREGERKLLSRREGEQKVALGSASLPWSAQDWEPEDPTSMVVLQTLGPEAQGHSPRPEAFWSVLKEPQKNILAGYKFEPSLYVSPLPPEGSTAPRSPMLKKREVVARGLWPWME